MGGLLFDSRCILYRTGAFEVLRYGIWNFRPFAPVILTLTRWPSYTNFTCIRWRGLHHMRKYELSTSRLSKVIVWQTYIHTDRHDRNYIPLRFAGGHIFYQHVKWVWNYHHRALSVFTTVNQWILQFRVDCACVCACLPVSILRSTTAVQSHRSDVTWSGGHCRRTRPDHLGWTYSRSRLQLSARLEYGLVRCTGK